MKSYTSIPKDEAQRDFFTDYAKFAGSISWLILVCQIVSGLTEAVTFYKLGYDTFSFYGDTAAKIVGFFLSVVGVCLIELFGLRFMLPQATRQLLYKRYKGAHLAMTFFILLVTLGLIAASFYLSIEGSSHTVASELDKNEQRQAEKIEGKHAERFTIVQSSFATDSTEIEKRYAILINATNQRHQAEQGEAESELRTWASRKGNYQTRINRAKTKIEGIKANRAKEVAALEQAKAMEHQNSRKQYKASKDSLQAVFTTELSTSQSDFEGKENTFQSVGLIAVLLAISLSIVCIIIQSIYLKGSGQKDIPLPSDFHFRQSPLREAWGAFTERIETKFRNKVVAYEQKTPQAELSKRLNPVFDRTDFRELVIKLEVEQLDDNARTIQIAAPQVTGTKPPQRKIGFKQQPDTKDLSTANQKSSPQVNATVNASNEAAKHWSDKDCDNCGCNYTAKVAWQRFCKEDCKLDWHGKQHGGKRYNPSKK